MMACTHLQEGGGHHARSPLGESYVTLSDSSADDMPPKPAHGGRVAKGWSPCNRTGGAGGLRWARDDAVYLEGVAR